MTGKLCIFQLEKDEGILDQDKKCSLRLWATRLEDEDVFECPTSIGVDGLSEFEECQPECPRGCSRNLWKCNDQCIDESKPCHGQCKEGKNQKSL